MMTREVDVASIHVHRVDACAPPTSEVHQGRGVLVARRRESETSVGQERRSTVELPPEVELPRGRKLAHGSGNAPHNPFAGAAGKPRSSRLCLRTKRLNALLPKPKNRTFRLASKAF